MANININRQVSDVFYRYKMPRLIAKVNNNISSIHASLYRLMSIFVIDLSHYINNNLIFLHKDEREVACVDATVTVDDVTYYGTWLYT